MSSSDDIADGGFSSLTDAVNPLFSPGALFQTNQPVDKSSGLGGEMIASCEDPTGNYQRLYVSSSPPNGRYWSMDASFNLTQRGSTDSTNQYIQGKTDMIAYAGEAYITTNSKLVRWSSIGSSNTFDTSFLSFNNAFAPHPALVFNGFAYYGDGNVLFRQSGAGVTPVAFLTLATGVIIVALGIDPGSGNILLSLIGQPNLSDTINSGASVAFYDGFSSQVLRYVQVDDMVTAFAPTEGSLYAAYGQSFGIWNGSGITFLRRMKVSFDNTELMYKHHFTSIGSTLYIIEKSRVIAYGPVRQKGDNVFYPVLNILDGSSNPINLTNIASVGTNDISVSYFTAKFVIWDSFNTSGTSNPLNMYSNSYDFDDEVWIRRIRVVYTNNVANNVSPGNITLLNESGVITNGGTGAGVYSLLNTIGSGVAFKDLLNVDQRVKQVQFLLNLTTGNYGIRRIIFYGDPANITGSSN